MAETVLINFVLIVQSEHVSRLVRIPGIVTAASKPKVS